MPNWVYTTMSVHGEKDALHKFSVKASQPYETFYPDRKTEFAEGEVNDNIRDGDLLFWNFIQPENKDAYFGSAHGEKPEGYESWSMEQKFAHDIKHTGDGWYDWNISNWGTKWEVNAVIEEEEDTFIQYSFETAWSPAEGAFQAMVKQHPELHFTFRCEEEQGWGVEYESEDGELTVTNEWDIPESHADWVAIDNESRCICQWEEDSEHWYDDCPNKKISEEELARVEDLMDTMG